MDPMEMNVKLAQFAMTIGDRYSAGVDQPLRGYATTMTVYGALVGGLTVIARMTGRRVPDGLSTADVVLSAAATHKLSRLLTRDPVTSQFRAPFTAFKRTTGSAELAEEPADLAAGKPVGELVTCPFCAAAWIGTGLTAGLVLLPRLTRLVIVTSAALAGADVLHFAHAWLSKPSNWSSSRPRLIAEPAKSLTTSGQSLLRRMVHLPAVYFSASALIPACPTV